MEEEVEAEPDQATTQTSLLEERSSRARTGGRRPELVD